MLTSALYLLCVLSILDVSGAAELQINGISEKRKAKVIAKLSPRLDYISKRDPSTWRADDAAFFLKRILIRSGHPEAEVKWQLPGSNTIELNAVPGPRYFFGDVRANDFSALTQKTLKQYFLQPLVETEIVKIDEAPYIEEYLTGGAENIKNYLRSLGYWNAQVAIESKKFDRINKKVHVNLTIAKGNLLTIGEPRFPGSRSVNLERFYPKISNYIGKPSTTENITKVKSIVEKFYRENGYQLAKINMSANHSSTETQLVFSIKSGEQYRVNKIIVTGVDKTKPRKVRRYFSDQEGKVFDENATNEALNKLIATGAFKSATLKPVIERGLSSPTVDLYIEVEETEARSFRAYAGLGSFEGYILGLGYTNLNYHGSLRRFYVGGEISGRGFLGEVGLTEPRFANAPIKLNTRAFLIERDYEGYRVRKAGFETSFIWTPEYAYDTRLYGNTTLVTTSSVSMTDSELGPADYLVTRFGLEQTVDFRDSRILPSNGFFGSALVESGVIGGDAENTYLMADLESSYRFQLGENSQVATRFRAAAIQPDNSSDLPIDVRLFSGGVNSQRAYDERELGPQSVSGDSLGGQAYWVASAEYIHTISDPLKMVIFMDMGQLYSDYDNLSFSDPSYAAGVGLRIDLPIGPVRLEYGHNLNQQKGEPRGSFHFSIGTAF